MHSKLIAALLAPLLTSGCMMAGMAGMGGLGHMSGTGVHSSGVAASPDGPLEVHEVIAGGLRVTSESPGQLVGDSLRVAVILRELDGRTITTDASVFLDVTPTSATGSADQPVPTHASHSARLAHQLPEDVALKRFAPYAHAGGQFEFRPSITPDGAYRLAVVVERVGDRVLDPPIVVSRVIQSHAAATGGAHAASARWGGPVMPLALLGAGLMALMMLVTLR